MPESTIRKGISDAERNSYIGGKMEERRRIRQALRSIALNSLDLRLNLGLGEIDAICQKD